MIKLENENFILAFDGTGNVASFIDKRNGGEMTDGERMFGSLSYTLVSDDITKLEGKPPYSPYQSREAAFTRLVKTEKGVRLENGELKASVEYSFEEDGALRVDFFTENGEFSEYGVNFPFNFSSKLKGGDWRKQFLFSSPYNSEDNKSLITYLTRPDKNAVVLIGDGNVDGWKMDYSPYIFGHFFINLKWLGNFDRAYATPRRELRKFTVWLYPVRSYDEALEKLYMRTGVPIATYDVSSVLEGEELEIRTVGDCEGLIVQGDDTVYPLKDGKAKLVFSGHGLRTVYPVYDGGKKGADCVAFVYRGIEEMFRKNLQHVGNEPLPIRWTNLCEGWTWVNTAVDYMRAYGKDEALMKKVDFALSVILTEDEEKARPHCTVWTKEHDGYPAYNVYRSNRIQEGFTGIWMMLDLFGLTGEIKYRDIAFHMCENYLKCYQDTDGGLKRVEHGRVEEYTTVCAPLVPIVDVALAAAKAGDPRAEWFKECAKRTAEFLYNRGFSFPTEGGTTALTQPEFEDGSISCTALSILYYCYAFERDERLISFAEEVLDVHDAWEIYSQIAPMKNSSLRWWETCWKDYGPSLCCGHCWTIWRAEADFWLAIIRADKEFMLRSYNGYMTNFSTQTDDGNIYQPYIIDYITGGGFDYSLYDTTKRNLPRFEVMNRQLSPVHGFTEERYCYNRMYHTWFKCVAVIGERTLFARRQGEELVRDTPELKWLFVADYAGVLKISAKEGFEVVTQEQFEVLVGRREGNFVYPDGDEVVLSF
ncbi:MAG: hypothetical protein IJY62_05910 [Clostridia bacterium]|nr:hypothetical protein [Clostridia bacterium]